MRNYAVKLCCLSVLCIRVGYAKPPEKPQSDQLNPSSKAHQLIVVPPPDQIQRTIENPPEKT